MTEPRINWPTPPPHWSLGKPDIHVWAASLHCAPDQIASFTAILSPDERQRAAQFTFDLHRHRFVAGRAQLRAILAQYLRCAPASLVFQYSPRGKPSLAAPHENFFFNLAHSDDLALYAVGREAAIGIDVEQIRAMNDAEGIAARFFSPRESAGLNALPESQRPAAFFNLWTRKEALLKATGEGIADSMNRVEVSFAPGEPACLLALAGDAAAARSWTLHALEPAAGFCGTLAVRATGAALYRWRWI